MGIGRLLRPMVPPFLWQAVERRFGTGVRYRGPEPRWERAAAHCHGYDAATIARRVEDATRRVLDGAAAYEQDGILFHRPKPPGAAFAGIALARARTEGPLRVLDFGGGLASHYLRWRPLLDPREPIEWVVVEQPGFVACGRALFDGRRHPVRFEHDVEDAGQVHAVLASGVLQYLENPARHLGRLASLAAETIVIDRAPLVEGDVQFFSQHLPPAMYDASYPLQTLPRSMIEAALSREYDLICEFPTSDEPLIAGGVCVPYLGQIWLRRS